MKEGAIKTGIYPNYLAEVGIRLELKPVPMQELLSIYYKKSPTEDNTDALAEFALRRFEG